MFILIGTSYLITGIVIVYVGGQLPNSQSKGGSNVINGTLLVHGWSCISDKKNKLRINLKHLLLPI